MEKEFNLSEKRFRNKKLGLVEWEDRKGNKMYYGYNERDVKEFIKRLKEAVNPNWCDYTEVQMIIDKLAGDKLI